MAEDKSKHGKDHEFLEDMMNSPEAVAESRQSARANEMVKKFNLSDQFTIATDLPIKELNSTFAKAFEVSSGKTKQEIYSVILPNSLPIRFKAVQQLRQFYNPNIANVIDAGFVDVARGEFGTYSIILEKPRGRKMSDFVAGVKQIVGEVRPPAKLLFTEDYLATNIVDSINEALKLFEDSQASHGRINHENVFITSFETPNLMVGECVSEPCGFSQFHQYEPIERAQSMPLGKGNSIVSNDYFALGVLVIYCLFGELPGRNVEMNEFIAQRLAKGTYNSYIGMLDLSPRITDLLRGLLVDTPEDRWGYEHVFNWVRGKKYNLIRPQVRKESVRSYEFGGIGHSSKRQIAHTYFLRWDEAANDLRDKKLGKWLELSGNDKNAADNLMLLSASTGGEKSKSRTEDDELVSKSIIVLDPAGPIRFRGIAAHIDGIGAVLANAWAQQNQSEIQTFSEVIRLNLIDYKAVHEEYAQKIDRWVLQRLANYIKIKTIGFGIERCLYDLNPSLPCQSSIVSHQYIVDINQLLYFLNDNSLQLASQDPVDRHIAAFLSSRLDISQEIKLKAMRHIKDEKVKSQLIKLALLAFAQRKSGAVRLSGLANWMHSRIKSVVEAIHSRRLRKELTDELKNLADQGNLEAMLQLISTADYFMRDSEGFAEAQRTFMIYDNELKNIRLRQGLSMNESQYYRFGLHLSKIIGVMVFVVTLIATMPKHVL